MLSHEEMIELQAEKHDLIGTIPSRTREEYVLHLVHAYAYEKAASLACDKKVLDLGCNTGYGTAILAKGCKEVIGVDVSQKAIDAARRLHTGPGMTFEVIDGKQLPFPSRTFDLVVSFQVIEHIVDYGSYVSELKRVLAPRGVILFTTPNAVIRLDPGMKPWYPFHVREFSPSELEAVLGGFFSNVSILGLFAGEPLYSVELERVQRARNSARDQSRGVGKARAVFMRQLKAAIPDSLMSRIKSARDIARAWSQPDVAAGGLSTDFVSRYSTADLYYQTTNLDRALDLLACCTDDAAEKAACLRALAIRTE